MKRFSALLLVALAILSAGCQKRQTAIAGVSNGDDKEVTYSVEIDRNRQVAPQK